MAEPSFHKTFTTSLPFLLAASFTEGGAVMAVELLGAKLVAPYYGSSLYVWSAVLAVTLGGLMAGYFLGSMAASGKNLPGMLFLVMLASAALTALMPHSSRLVMEATLGMELRAGITLSCLVFLMPPLVLFGTVSPVIIRLIASARRGAGKSAGTVYAVSTLGGLVVTFLFGFYIIPEMGMRTASYATAAALAVFPAVHGIRTMFNLKMS